VSPSTPTTNSGNTDTSTCPWKLSPLVWDPLVMIYPFLRSLGLSISQVSHSGPPIPLPLLPSIILPSPCSQTAFPPFPHHSVHKYTTILHFTCPLLPSCIFPFPAPSPTIFAFLGLLWFPPVTSTSPHLSTSHWIAFQFASSPA
jgi:hypothetical protein